MIMTPLFQREMLVILLKDPEAYRKYCDIWQPSYFDDVNHRAIATAFIKARVMAKEHPTKATLLQEALGDLKDYRQLPIDKEQQLEELEVLYAATPRNHHYTIEKVREAARNESIRLPSSPRSTANSPLMR